MESSEVDIPTIHDVDGAGFWNEQIERMHIVKFAVGDMNETGNIAAQIEQRMHLHCCLCRTEMRPRKYRQAQIDCCRVEGVYRVRQFESQVFLRIKLPRLGNQSLCEVGIDSPVAQLVGIGQR